MPADADSPTGRISQAMATVIRGLRLSGVTVAMRKKLVTLDGDGARMALVTVADSEAYEPLGVMQVGTKPQLTWLVSRPCGVALGYSSTGRQGDNPDLREDRARIEAAMTMGALQAAGLNDSIAACNDVKPAGRAVFDASQKSQGTDWSVMTFTVETLENEPYGI